MKVAADKRSPPPSPPEADGMDGPRLPVTVRSLIPLRCPTEIAPFFPFAKVNGRGSSPFAAASKKSPIKTSSLENHSDWPF